MLKLKFNYYSGWVGGWSDKTKLILISTLVEVLVEVLVELGKISMECDIALWMTYWPSPTSVILCHPVAYNLLFGLCNLWIFPNRVYNCDMDKYFFPIRISIFSKDTQNGFAHSSATKYCSETVMYSKRTAGYTLSPHIKTISVAFLQAE